VPPLSIVETRLELPVRLVHPAGHVPERSREGDAGYDLRSVAAFALEPGERALVGTGIALALPDDVAGLVLPRSGLAIRHGITTLNAPGLIDPNYRGEVRVILHNAGNEPYAGEPGDRIAQLLLVPFASAALSLVGELPPSADDRGELGFGSSGR
jgi:dUTP pyrophosphatase